MIVLDTTVLIYAVGDDHPLREPARRLLAAHGDGQIEAATSVEVIQEFAHVRARRRDRRDAADLARNYVRALTVLTTTADELEYGLGVFEQHPSVGAFDAVLAAMALSRGAEALVSGDRAFEAIAGLSWVDLGGGRFEGWLRSRWFQRPEDLRGPGFRARC